MKVLSVMVTQEYCGGAAPSEEVLKDLMDARPLSNAKIYIAKSGAESDHVHEYKLDKNGKVNIAFEGTDYRVYYYNPVEIHKEMEEANSKEPNNTNGQDGVDDCLPAWKLLIASDLHIEEDQNEYNVHMHIICDPCELRP